MNFGEHGIVIGNLEKNNITYEFKNMEYRHFNELNIDITNFKSPNEILNYIETSDDIYKINLIGEKNIDIDALKDILISTEKNICEINDYAHIPYDLKNIAKQQNLKGFFTKKMLEELEKDADHKDEIMKAIELTYQVL